MDNAVHGCDCGLSEVMIPEIHCVGYLCRVCGFCHNCVAEVVLQCYTSIPDGCTVEVPRVFCPCILVCDYITTKGTGRCGVIIELSVKV